MFKWNILQDVWQYKAANSAEQVHFEYSAYTSDDETRIPINLYLDSVYFNE